VKASTVAEAVQKLKNPEDEASLIAGGMVMVIMMKERIVTPKTLVDILKIPALSKISYDERDGLTIGATATHRQIETSPFVVKNYPSLRDAFHTIGNVRVRSVGTIGGNLAYAEPHCNPPAILSALDAQVHVVGQKGQRTIAAEDFVRGIFESALEPGEIITHVTVPAPKPRSSSGFYKFTTRSATDKPTATVAVCIELDPSMKRVYDCRIAVGATGPKTYRCSRAEEMVKAASGTDNIDFAAVGKKASQEIEIIEDADGPEWYKRQTTAVIVGDVLRKVVGGATRRGGY
jgi:aerobic carbon-monoxide dehydrogenase medium subunit